ncbi:MAG: hypothetical protein Phyf2KO_11440 [Phycisphaerales bacterium]
MAEALTPEQESQYSMQDDAASGSSCERWPVLVIGGGPAGLSGAYELLKHAPDMKPLVVEAGQRVGGIARTEEYKGYRFDIGGHRFFTKVKPVEELWQEIMGDEMIDVPRSSRIYYRGRFYDYPLSIGNALGNLGIYESARVALSFAKWKVFPSKEEENFEQWVSNRFGGRLYWHFFRTYTEKVWGIPPTEIRADWAAQRIKDLSLTKAVFDALTGKGDTASLIKTFKYPRLGPGQMWETAADLIEDKGGEVRLQTRAGKIHREGNRVTGVEIETRDAGRTLIECDHVMNSMPITELVRCISPAAPDEVLEAADRLNYRDFLIVTLVLNHPDPFDDNWIYIHSPDVKVGRIQNFRAWSEAMLPNQSTASIGMEYFCHEGDGLWNSSDDELIDLAKQELEKLDLAPASSVVDGTVIRQPKAYPVYDADYKANLDVIKDWLLTFENLQSVGRNGMHRYNNQDHSMLAAMLAARNIVGESHDIWSVNVERSYHEDFVVDKKDKGTGSESGDDDDPDGARSAPISVVIPVHNGGENLDSAVRAVLESSVVPADIIIADDGSTDGAPERAADIDARVRVLRVSDNPGGPARARNAGAQDATQDIIVFVDADVRVQRETLAALIEPLRQESGVIASFGSYDSTPEAAGAVSIYANIRHHYVHQNAGVEAETFWSGLGAVQREAFLDVGGFDETFTKPSIEDVELGVRLRKNGRIKVVKGATATHLKRWSLGNLWRTDVVARALPWGRLSVEHEELRGSLNSSRREQLAALLAGLLCLAVLLLPITLAAMGTFAAAASVVIPAGLWGWLNRKLFGLIARRGGVVAFVVGVLLHFCYFLYAVVTYMTAVTWFRWKSWLRSDNRSVPFLLFSGVTLVCLGGVGLSLVILGFVSTQSVLDAMTSLEGSTASPRYNLETLGPVQHRLVVFGLALLGMSTCLANAGPRALLSGCQSGFDRLKEIFVIPKPDLAMVGVFTLIACVLGVMHINQQMRLDEASSFAMYASASPLVSLLTYDTPNNHILHSTLMWMSVSLFGPSEITARLPAFAFSMLIPVCMLAAGRSLLSPMIALVGAGIYAGSVIGVDIATNARGYPIVIVAMLVLIGLLPALRNREPGAGIAAVVVGAIGFYACPVMAYPIAFIFCGWLLVGPAKGTPLLQHALDVLRTGIATLGLVALFYAPAWALSSGSGPVRTLGRAAKGYMDSDGFLRYEELSFNLHAAWSQWTWPMPSLVAIALFALALSGIWMWLSRTGWPRALVVGLVLGTLGVYAMSGLAPPPWWILVWFVPILCFLWATPISMGAVLVSPKPVVASVTGFCAALVASLGVLLSGYPTDFPYRLGTKDAPQVVEHLAQGEPKSTHIVASPQVFRLLNFEFEKRGFGRQVVDPTSALENLRCNSVTHVRGKDADVLTVPEILPADFSAELELIDSTPIGDSVIDVYSVIPVGDE